MSVARTPPVGPTSSQSQLAIDPPPPPTSRHRAPLPTPSSVIRRFVFGSRYCSSNSSRRLARSHELSSAYPVIGPTSFALRRQQFGRTDSHARSIDRTWAPAVPFPERQVPPHDHV